MGKWSIAPLNFRPVYRLIVNFMHQQLCPREKDLQQCLNRELGGFWERILNVLEGLSALAGNPLLFGRPALQKNRKVNK